MLDLSHWIAVNTGFANFYKSMPCVGGYTDGPVSKFGRGNLSIVSGENRDYGFKPIGVFQTSDSRRRDHSTLGIHTTWVKWAEPTAEALRQACLVKESRISAVAARGMLSPTKRETQRGKGREFEIEMCDTGRPGFIGLWACAESYHFRDTDGERRDNDTLKSS
jgi:hypothetical protein